MDDNLVKILIATYSVILPVLLGYVIKALSKIKNDKVAGHEQLVSGVQQFTSQIADVTRTVEELSYKINMNEAMTSRYRIIRAADELRNGQELSAEHLEQLGEDVEIYKNFCAENKNYKNHKGQASMRLVLEYEEKMLASNLSE